MVRSPFQHAGRQVLHEPFEAEPDALDANGLTMSLIEDVIAGHIDIMSITIGLASPPARAGQLKLLGVGAKARLEPAPDVPAIAETVPGYESSTWFGLFAPAATPRDIVTKLSEQTQRIFADAAFKEKFLSPQMLSSLAGTPEQFAALIKADTVKWSKVLREAGIKLE